MSAGKTLQRAERERKAVIFILVLQLDRLRLWSAIGLNKVDAVYFFPTCIAQRALTLHERQDSDDSIAGFIPE
jgi:hypothetical protein